MRVLLILLPMALTAQVTAPRSPAKPKPAPPTQSTAQATSMTDEQKTIYALGLSIYRSLGPFNLSPGELAIVEKAMSDASSGKPALELNEWGPKIQPFAQTRAAAGVEKEKAASEAFLAKAAEEQGAIKTDSGLVYRELRPGTGASPDATSTVKVNYRGTLVNGTEFDNSYSRNEPAQFALNGVIRCWTEGLQKMKVGGKAQLVCPANLAYGDAGRPGIPGGAALIFEIELLDLVGPNPPVSPATAAPPQ
ncbi:MAG: FKBP-type peptidyl-prolyl cis-trans isomerase [Acidobacteriaceae bacterium]|nr:FKBP-type peptidyl-prolyl cis-trans isomerase [Acidobacteriaceae bacterium]